MSIFEVQTIELAPQGSKRPLKRLKQALGMVWPPTRQSHSGRAGKK
jgi:hypothetical protein